MTEKTIAQHGRIDVLCNNAAVLIFRERDWARSSSTTRPGTAPWLSIFVDIG